MTSATTPPPKSTVRILFRQETSATELNRFSLNQMSYSSSQKRGQELLVRPSGTEPKIKFYVSVNHVMKEGEDYGSIRQKLKQRVQDLFVSFGA